MPPGGHRRRRRGQGRAALAKDSGEGTHARQGVRVPPRTLGEKPLWSVNSQPHPNNPQALDASWPPTGNPYLDGPEAEAIEQGSGQ